MNPTPTPRVDAAIERWKNRPWAGSPTDRPLMLARELERELADIKAERDQLRAEAERSKAQSVRGFTYEELEVLWDKLRTDYDKARARVAELEQDKARLDAHEAITRAGMVPGPRRDDEGNFLGWEWEAHKRPLFPTFRAAIDVARLPPVAITKGNTSGTDVPPSCKTEGSSDAARVAELESRLRNPVVETIEHQQGGMTT